MHEINVVMVVKVKKMIRFIELFLYFSFQCLKCSHHFTKVEAKKSTDCQKMPSSGSSLDLENLKNLGRFCDICVRTHSLD